MSGKRIAEFTFATDEGEVRKMIMQDPVTMEGKTYPSVWVNVNDGKEVKLQISDSDRQALLDMGITGIYLNEKFLAL